MQQLKKKKDPYYFRFMILTLTSWFFVCTACVSMPGLSDETVENDLMEMIILYENIMPKIFDNDFFYNEHNRKFLDVQYRKLEQLTDKLASNIDNQPTYLRKTGFFEQDPAIQMGLRPIVDNLIVAVTAYQVGNLDTSRSALKRSIQSVVAMTSSPALTRVNKYANVNHKGITKNFTGDSEIRTALSAMKLARFNLLSNEFSIGEALEKPQSTEGKDLALFQRQGSALHSNLKRAGDTDERVRSMYELGKFYAKYQKFDYKGLASAYLQSCIRLLPGSSLAEKCYVVLRRNVYNKYSGLAADLNIGKDDKKTLQEMKILSQPRVLSVGMVGGLENFY